MLMVLVWQQAYGRSTDGDGNVFDLGSNDATVSAPQDKDQNKARTDDVLIFDNQAEFLAAAGPVTTEDFEDEPVVGTCDSMNVPTITVDDFSATTVPEAAKLLDIPCFGNHNTTPGGVKYLSFDTDAGGVSSEVTITFNSPISALGFYIIDLDNNPLEVTINDIPYTVPATGDEGEAYFGIISNTSFTTIGLRILTGYDSHYSVDDVAYSADGESNLIISPPSGDYVTTQGFDLTLIVYAPGLTVVGGSATLDGSDVTPALVSCIIPGTLISGGQTFRCPGITGGFLGTGTHTFGVTLNLSDGSSVSDSVTWEVKENTEP